MNRMHAWISNLPVALPTASAHFFSWRLGSLGEKNMKYVKCGFCVLNLVSFVLDLSSWKSDRVSWFLIKSRGMVGWRSGHCRDMVGRR